MEPELFVQPLPLVRLAVVGVPPVRAPAAEVAAQDQEVLELRTGSAASSVAAAGLQQ